MLKEFLLDLLFPKFCLGCKKEGSFLCQDCLATINFAREPLIFKKEILEKVYFIADYSNPVLKKAILQFKYEPFLKELAKDFGKLFEIYFQILAEKPNFSNFILVPIPLDKKRENWRGYNQSEQLARVLSKLLKIPLMSNLLLKKRKTLPQILFKEKERKENIKDAFFIAVPEKVKGGSFLLVDDVFTTGATMREAAKVLKEGGAKKIWGIVLAVAKIGEELI
ncbi:ComF family protein [Candidatus Parcubacteria bacterium]|nr:ComF family protein [Candidatus Parcubacteria bacterium]